jgi:hypothetical protein
MPRKSFLFVGPPFLALLSGPFFFNFSSALQTLVDPWQQLTIQPPSVPWWQILLGQS